MGGRNYLSLAQLNDAARDDCCGAAGEYADVCVLATYDAEIRTDFSTSKRKAFSTAQIISAIALACFSWIFFHECMHYFSCALPGGNAYVLSVLPTPEIACDAVHLRTPAEALLYYLSPYLASILVLLAFLRINNSFLRLIPYTAFFDLQFNLFLTSAFGGRFGARENDALYLLDHLDSVSPSYPFFRLLFVLAILLLIASSLLVFYSGYRRDLALSRNRRFFSLAVAFYAVFYAASLGALYIL